MIKKSQIFGWEHEPAAERPSEFMPSKHYGSLRGEPPAKAFGNAQPAVATSFNREPPSPRDGVLSSFALAWMDTLPSEIRPVNLCAAYPRIANRMALCWSDPQLTYRLFERLFNDQRGGRKGFPPAIAAELVRLRSASTKPRASAVA